MSDFYAQTMLWERDQWIEFFYEDRDWLLYGQPILLWNARLLHDTAIEYKGFIPVWVTDKKQYIPLPFMRHTHLRNAWKMCVTRMQDTIPYLETERAWDEATIYQDSAEARQALIYWFKSGTYLQQEFCRRDGTFPALPEPLRAIIDTVLAQPKLKVARGLRGNAQDLHSCNLMGFYIHDVWYAANYKNGKRNDDAKT